MTTTTATLERVTTARPASDDWVGFLWMALFTALMVWGYLHI